MYVLAYVCLCAICLYIYLCKEKRLEGVNVHKTFTAAITGCAMWGDRYFFVLFWIFSRVFTMSRYYFGTRDKR